MKNELPKLEYSYDTLEPHIDAKTMEIHHSKHHQAYVDKLNAALKSEGLDEDAEVLLKDLSKVPGSIRQAVINHGGGHWNHSFFWKILKKGTTLSGKIKDAIDKDFGSFEKFRDEFTKAAATRFGSGWAWLVLDNKTLKVVSTPNQGSPISKGLTPILCLDVWEHAYYLKYQNKRPEYIENFFNVINWDKVNEHFLSAAGE